MATTTIDNDNEHALAMSCIEEIMDATTPEDGAVLVSLAEAVETYENARWPI